MEKIYADHANKLKALGNRARLEMIKVENARYSPAAKAVYLTEVRSLDAKLKIATNNAPYERYAQRVGNYIYNSKKAANPQFDRDDLKKLRGESLAIARDRVGADKKRIDISAREWEAIQSGAISTNKLEKIVANTDKNILTKLALPKSSPLMSPGKISRAKSMIANGYTRDEIAEHLGVSESTLNSALV
jgi:AraC-like DNA-binding protein